MGQFYLGQFLLGPSIDYVCGCCVWLLLCVCVLCVVCCVVCVCCVGGVQRKGAQTQNKWRPNVVRVRRVGGREEGGPRGVGVRREAARRVGGPTFRCFFFHSPALEKVALFFFRREGVQRKGPRGVGMSQHTQHSTHTGRTHFALFFKEIGPSRTWPESNLAEVELAQVEIGRVKLA